MRPSTPVAVRPAAGHVEELVNTRWAERAGRVGLLSRALTYMVLSVLVAAILVGRGGHEADSTGAVDALSRGVAGRALLVLLCLGFVCVIGWQLLRAVARRNDQGDAANAGRRVLALGIVLVYAGSLVTTVRVLVGSSATSPQSEQESWTANLLAAGGGRLLVAACGAALIIAGLALGGYAVSRRFEVLLDTSSMSPAMRRLTAVLGIAGQVSRAIVFMIIGGFVLSAALTGDAHHSKGLDASLRTLAAEPFGMWLLAVVALGFLCFGAYSLVDARYRQDFSR